MWITNAIQADFLCLLCNTPSSNPEKDNIHTNKSMIIVPTNTPGVSFSEKLDKMGMRSSDTAQVFFDDVRVPQKNLVGEEGKGFSYQMQQFQEERLGVVAFNLKVMETCIQETIAYCEEREIFGQPIINNQVVNYRMAELQTEVEALRALLYSGIEGYINGEDVTLKASMAKLKVGRLLREVSDSCLQYWGGMGFMEDNIVSRIYRDARLISIGGGADEVMLGIISKGMGINPKKKKK
jgi:citronellyl-CoA dehydrogenase